MSAALWLLAALARLAAVIAVDHSGSMVCKDGLPRNNVTACDGVWQCPGGEDENTCTSCAPGATYCGGQCLQRQRLCDGFSDCPGGEDERDCGPKDQEAAPTKAPASRSCPRGEFDCGASKTHCIKKSFVCNGVDDCISGLDEQDCSECAPLAFRCHTGWCEHKARCDGNQQCPGGEDELGCSAASRSSLLTCADGTTRLSSTRCDGWLACPGGDDERNCTRAECKDGAFFCDGVCKPASRRCDGVRHCSGGEDEAGCSTESARPSSAAASPACGAAVAGVDALVANGTKAEPGAYPWHAALYLRGSGEMNYICGASLVADNVLLSAAHCFHPYGSLLPASNFTVALGKLHSGWDAESIGVHKSNVSKVVVHPDYDGVLGKHGSDVAVVHLESAAPKSSSITPVCLWGVTGEPGPLRPRDLIKVVGWGNGATALDELESVNLPYLPRRQCLQTLRRSRPNQLSYITYDKFCAIRETGVVSPGGLVKGDSGGGAVVLRAGRWYLVGIVSLGLNDGHLSAFTNLTISDTLSWVEDVF